MDLKLRFLGATRNVTGSKFLLEANGKRIIVDYGMYQEWKLKVRNWRELPVSPESIDAVILTHAHLDHCGLTPKLVAEGFRGKIYCTPASAGIARIVMEDSARLQQEDASYKLRRHKKEGRSSPHPVVPLYTVDEAATAISQLVPVRYKQEVEVAEGVTVSFHDAGHILGSSMVKVQVQQGEERRTIIFSGDVGRSDKPILRDPTFFEEADYVLMESTYGDRVHEDPGDLDQMLSDVVNTTAERGGNIIIPAFAIGRTQELLYRLNELLQADRIPHLATFVDSPMAIRVTDVFKRHPELFDEEMREYMQEGDSPFAFETLKMSRSSKQSKAINHIRGTVIVLAGSGMCTGGRVKHHLVHNITKPESTVLFVGYQAQGTLGGHISRGGEVARIHGKEYRVRANIAQIHGFSAHADRDELLTWISSLKRPPREVFVVHGDEEPSLAFAKHAAEKTGWTFTVPEWDSEVSLA